jgi:hypothetical protein
MSAARSTNHNGDCHTIFFYNEMGDHQSVLWHSNYSYFNVSMTYLLSKCCQGMWPSLCQRLNWWQSIYMLSLCNMENMKYSLHKSSASPDVWCECKTHLLTWFPFLLPLLFMKPVYSEQHPKTMYMPHQLHLLMHHCKCALCTFSPIINHIHSPSNWTVTSIPWILLHTTNTVHLIKKFLNVIDVEWAQKKKKT